MDAEAVREYDRRVSALHEAGHLTACLAFGVRARAWIEEREVADPMHAMTSGGMAGGCAPIPDEAAPVIAVAGAVAEMSLEEDFHEMPAEAVAEMAADSLLYEEWSPTDRELFGEVTEERVYAVCVEAAAQLQQHRRFFEWAAAELVAEGAITDGDAAGCWEELEGEAVPGWHGIIAPLDSGEGEPEA